MGYVDYTEVIAKERSLIIGIKHIASNKSISFKSFVESFDDSPSSNWKPEEVYGRMDPIGIFQSTSRNIKISFHVIAADEKEAYDNFSKISLLYNMHYPVYKDINQDVSLISASPLLKVKFGNWIMEPYYVEAMKDLLEGVEEGAKLGAHVGALTHSPSTSLIDSDATFGALMGAILNASDPQQGLVCFSSGFSFSPNFEAGTFVPVAGVMLPIHMKIDLNLTAIHTKTLGWDENGELRNPSFPYGMNNSFLNKEKIPQTQSDETIQKFKETILEGSGGYFK